MVKLFTHTEEIEHCGECANCCPVISKLQYYCYEKGKNIKDIWGELPKFCPLEEKK